MYGMYAHTADARKGLEESREVWRVMWPDFGRLARRSSWLAGGNMWLRLFSLGGQGGIVWSKIEMWVLREDLLIHETVLWSECFIGWSAPSVRYAEVPFDRSRSASSYTIVCQWVTIDRLRYVHLHAKRPSFQNEHSLISNAVCARRILHRGSQCQESVSGSGSIVCLTLR